MKSEKVKKFFGSFRGESVIVSFTLIASIITILNFFPKLDDPLSRVVVAFSSVIILLLYALLFNLKRFYRERFKSIENMFKQYQTIFEIEQENFKKSQQRIEKSDKIMIDLFGFSWRENQYFSRLQHFVDEKKLLSGILVKKLLPDIVDKICDQNSKIKNIKIILDSGTTITPVFPHLIRTGVPTEKSVKFSFYTNNLAGIDEIHKLDKSEKTTLSERDFNLIGGRPLSKYRATTGNITQDFLKSLFLEQQNSKGETIIIGIITANWIIGGTGLQEMQICARGEGHFDFKVMLIENCLYVIVVAPLGKILPLAKVDELNGFISKYEQKYQAYKIPENLKNTTYLLTSFRDICSVSPLNRMSDSFKNVFRRGDNKNFRFYSDTPEFDPKNNIQESILIDLPHKYIRENFRDIYGYPLPLPVIK